MSDFDYRLFFVDHQGAIQAREDFRARSDGEALTLCSLLFEACSDTYAGYELWSLGRRVVCASNGIGLIPLPLLEEVSRDHQEAVLALEESLRRSRWRVAQSRQLIDAAARLHERLRAEEGR